MKLPLEGVLVLEFCQYLAGPYAGLRMADLGATVVKIERPGSGDACRQLVTMNQRFEGDSLLFHTINRNKSSLTANLKDPDDLTFVKDLIKKADVVTHNFRPGVMEKIGLDYPSVKEINDKIIYAQVTGYGQEGPWRDKPGQDLLAQSLSGLTFLSGNADDHPTPFGIAVADMLCGTHLVQGVLAALIRRERQGIGALVEVSLVESMLDLQFEAITSYLNNGKQQPKRSRLSNAHPMLAAPYGIYETSNGYIALSIIELKDLVDAMGCPNLLSDEMIADPYELRDEIKSLIQDVLLQGSIEQWLGKLQSEGIWCSDVLDYEKMLNHKGYQALNMEIEVVGESGAKVKTTRCPIRWNGRVLQSAKAAPKLGNANHQYRKEGA